MVVVSSATLRVRRIRGGTSVRINRGKVFRRERRILRLVGDGAGELGEDAAEDQVGNVGGDPLLVETAFVEHPLMQSTRVGCPVEKGFPAKQQDEQLQPVATSGLGECKEVVVVAGKSRTAARSISKNCSETDRAP